MALNQISDQQANKSVSINENFEAVQPAALFGIKRSLSVGLVFAWYGGLIWNGSAFGTIADGTIALTGSTTNYIEADSAGVVYKNTSAFTSGRQPLYTVTTNSTGITGITDYRVAVGAYAGARHSLLVNSKPGTVAAGTQNLNSITTTYTGHSGGTSDVRSLLFNANTAGSNAIAVHVGILALIDHDGSATVTSQIGLQFQNRVTSSGSVTTVEGVRADNRISGAGNVTNSYAFSASVPSFTSTGATTTYVGFNAANLGNANVTTAIGFRAQDITASTNMRGFQSSVSSGSNKYNAYFDGTADNYFAGKLVAGTTTNTNMSNGDIRTAGALWLGDGITAPTTTTGFAAIYVDTADGDLKVKFGDGTTKTLATDT